jgi:hypothetical protein
LTVLALLSTILAIPTILTTSLANNLQQRGILLYVSLSPSLPVVSHLSLETCYGAYQPRDYLQAIHPASASPTSKRMTSTHSWEMWCRSARRMGRIRWLWSMMGSRGAGIRISAGSLVIGSTFARLRLIVDVG